MGEHRSAALLIPRVKIQGWLVNMISWREGERIGGGEAEGKYFFAPLYEIPLRSYGHVKRHDNPSEIMATLNVTMTCRKLLPP